MKRVDREGREREGVKRAVRGFSKEEKSREDEANDQASQGTSGDMTSGALKGNDGRRR